MSHDGGGNFCAEAHTHTIIIKRSCRERGRELGRNKGGKEPKGWMKDSRRNELLNWNC